MFRSLLAVTVLALACALPAHAVPAADVAAVQVGLRTLGLYEGAVDGQLGPMTHAGVRSFQRRAGLEVDGIPGPRTRTALQRRAATRLDVAALQFRLARHGFPSGPFDGRPGPRTEAALRGFQRFAGLRVDGIAGPATLAALSRPPATSPIALRPPLDAPLGDGFGARGDRFHTGLDFMAPAGHPVRAAAAGQVTFAGPLTGGWGIVVTVDHGRGILTMYAHLSRIDVHVGQRIGAGVRIGAVGATGNATGPHLHFEVRLRGAALDPAAALSR